MTWVIVPDYSKEFTFPIVDSLVLDNVAFSDFYKVETFTGKLLVIVKISIK